MIQLESVRKSYGEGAGKTEVLRGVSLSVPRGELIALVGQSGSGKSTLLNIVGGLDKADGGTVRVLGHDYRQTGEQALARLRNAKIGFVFALISTFRIVPVPYFFPGTLRTFVAYGLKTSVLTVGKITSPPTP